MKSGKVFPNVCGYIVVNAPFSALNNQGKDEQSTLDNALATKSTRRAGGIYPFVSGGAYRHWLRETLAESLGWTLSPIDRQEKTAFSAADPFTFEDDDLFGYMRAESKKKGKKGKKGKKQAEVVEDTTSLDEEDEAGKEASEAITRRSPLQMSALLSITPSAIIRNFAVRTCPDGDPVPFTYQAYSAVLEGAFSIFTPDAGRFTALKQAGRKNLDDELREKARAAGAYVLPDNSCILPSAQERFKRVADVIQAFHYVHGGAMSNHAMTSVSPQFMVLGLINGGNNPLTCLGKSDGPRGMGKPSVCLDTLAARLRECKAYGQLLSRIYVACYPNFMSHLDLEGFGKKMRAEGIDVEVGMTPGQAILSFVKEIEKPVMDQYLAEQSLGAPLSEEPQA